MATTTRPHGFAPWRPQRGTLALVERVSEVLAEYEAYLPLTVRQVFYRLVGGHGYDKTEHAYARLGEALNRARRAGLVPFGAIRDDGAARVEAHHWAGPEAFQADVARWARGFRLDRQGGQHRRLWLLCEAAGMAPMLARAADPYGVRVLSSGGFDSLTAKHALARELAACDAPAAEVLHVGDLDPSGEHLFASLAEDVGAMTAALGGAVPRFSRLAVTSAQAAALDLPTAPPKHTDRRSFSAEATVQAEAIAPDALSALVRDAIEARRCARAHAAALRAEAEARAELAQWAARGATA